MHPAECIPWCAAPSSTSSLSLQLLWHQLGGDMCLFCLKALKLHGPQLHRTLPFLPLPILTALCLLPSDSNGLLDTCCVCSWDQACGWEEDMLMPFCFIYHCFLLSSYLIAYSYDGKEEEEAPLGCMICHFWLQHAYLKQGSLEIREPLWVLVHAYF